MNRPARSVKARPASAPGRTAPRPDTRLLVLGGLSSSAVAGLHVVILFLGAPAYRYFGAGERTALQAEAGSLVPATMTVVLIALFTAFAGCAFSGARLMRRLPRVREGLVIIGAVYFLRGLAIVPQAVLIMQLSGTMPARYLAFSAVSLLMGIVHLLGTHLSWDDLGRP